MSEENIVTTATSPTAHQFTQNWQTATLSSNALLGERSYYRSKIFTTTIGINPLIAAASPLLSVASQITESAAAYDTHTLYQHLAHEIKAFENNAQTQQYRSEMILIARYILCATLDELILKVHNAWENHKLLVAFHHESNGDERFFIILERLMADPAIHIDLLELIYMCFNLGFEGKYRDSRGSELEQITEKLFDTIRLQRGELKKELSLTYQPATRPPVTKLRFPVWLIITFAATILLTIYCGYSYLLTSNATRLYQEINPLIVNNTQLPNDN